MHTNNRSSPWQRLAFILLTAFVFHGCAPARPVPLDIPAFREIAQIEIDNDSTLSWDNTGERLLVSGKGLRLIILASGEERSLSALPAGVTAWSPAGDRIAAAAFEDGDEDESQIRVLSSASGELLDSRKVPGRVAGIFWSSPNEVLIASAVLEVYSFGANFRFLLHRFEPGGEMSSTVLSDATVKPGTAKYLGSRYERVFHVDFSPFRDEVIYTRFHDPPEAFPYLRLVVHHLDTASKRVIDELSLTAAGAVLARDGERVYYDAGRQGVVGKGTWSNDPAVPLAAKSAAATLDAGGSYLLVDNQLYDDGRLVASLPAGADYSLSTGGNRLAARQDSVLQVFALPTTADPLPQLGEAKRDKLLWLRRWRSQGLISPAEYQERKQRIVQP